MRLQSLAVADVSILHDGMQRLLGRIEPMFRPYLSEFFLPVNLLFGRVQSTVQVVPLQIFFSHVLKVSLPRIEHSFGFLRKPILALPARCYH